MYLEIVIIMMIIYFNKIPERFIKYDDVLISDNDLFKLYS